MRCEGYSEREITSFIFERERRVPDSDGLLSPAERIDLEKRSWWWESNKVVDDVESWTLDTRFLLSIEFLPQICFLIFLEKIHLTDRDFRERHLRLSRELARMLGVEEFLIVFDSAAPSSAVYGNFPSEDFSFQKKWLLDNVGSPKNSLEEMQIEL